MVFDLRNDAVTFDFLNVGPSDCTIVYWPPQVRQKDNSAVAERIMMVDIYHEDGGVRVQTNLGVDQSMGASQSRRVS
jgi:hypothetical protein